MKRYCVTLFLILMIHFKSFAQSTFELGLLPSLNINKKLPKDWSLNFKTESRQSLFKEDFNYDFLLTEISIAVSKKKWNSYRCFTGLFLRIDDEGHRNRTIQQITFVRRYATFRLAHRILADQTFKKDDNTELRFRYRL